ncbi:MAG: hypothetical protein ATN32_06265 [Candidatus Epulonipiscium fishelsonii]|nr:MAG: hypothetical protein ATN32_06265 [Epulopiscium sp. AS2M-Bin002]
MNYEYFIEQMVELKNILEDDISKEIFEAIFLQKFEPNISCLQILKNVSDKTPYIELIEDFKKDFINDVDSVNHIALYNHQILSSKDNVVLFGLSNYGMDIFEALDLKRIENLVWCVKDPGTVVKACGKPVISYQDLILNYRSYKLVLMPFHYKVAEELLYIGFNKENIYQLAPFNANQYFDSIVKLSQDEIFVDLGALYGGTSIEFARRTNYTYKQIYIFEPDSLSYERTKNNITKADLKNVEIFNIGGWSKKDTLSFNNTGVGRSKISDNGTSKVEVDSLDNVLGDTPVTFIKMDIEGAELEALIGAKEIIQKYKPHLAISVYHKPEDIFEIPLYIKKLVPEYKLYIRHYGLNDKIDTVLHAFI